MTTIRRPAAVLPAVTMVCALAGMLVVTAAGSAHADGGRITAPASTVSARGPVEVTAEIDGLCDVRLVVSGPDGEREIARDGVRTLLCRGSKTIGGSFDPGDAVNRAYVVVLKGAAFGTVYDTRAFDVSVPPRRPAGVSAAMRGKTRVAVRWRKGAESDLTAYQVTTEQGRRVGTVAVDQACSGSSCTTTVAVPQRDAGRQVGFVVRAVRSDGQGGTLVSGGSSVAYVSVPAEKPPAERAETLAAGRRIQNFPVGTPGGVPEPRAPGPSEVPPPLPSLGEREGEEVIKLPEAVVEGQGGVPGTPSGGVALPQAGDTTTDKINQYGFLIVSGLLLLLIGGHAGAWLRRRGPSPGRDLPRVLVATPRVGPGAHARHKGRAADTASPLRATGGRGAPSVRRRPTVVLTITKRGPLGREGGVLPERPTGRPPDERKGRGGSDPPPDAGPRQRGAASDGTTRSHGHRGVPRDSGEQPPGVPPGAIPAPRSPPARPEAED
ncbi:hypothetical protein [Spongiactinospora sp. TRM90649]|uniref:hypothetical protein n=1 Tax=Spongiactinospora sp. TRM90649 TaxID=3031114 RepID=UPI0023F968A3|nr:hypothetical protein [Spongiactinospora sp. TRM90649]MDF5754872.1 hypothetical protein [Spongiactinospora sp. TRM90649]